MIYMYEYWIDGDGQKHLISEMKTQYIKNCISQINNAVLLYSTIKNDEDDSLDNDSDSVLSSKWCRENADFYLQVFKNELEIRHRVRKKDYPIINMRETCDTCNEHKYGSKCDNGKKCENWTPSGIMIREELNDNDWEIARRAGYKCNGITYRQPKED